MHMPMLGAIVVALPMGVGRLVFQQQGTGE